MTLFLRNEKNETIVDVEIYVDHNEVHPNGFIEIDVAIAIDKYSELLLNNLDNKDEIVGLFTQVSELRSWLWESFFVGDDNDPSKYDDVVISVRMLLKSIGKKYKLHFIID